MRNKINDYQPTFKKTTPCKTVIVADSVFFKRSFGFCVLRADKIRKNIYWQEIDYERIEAYARARNTIEGQGFTILAVVTDGRPGVRAVFGDRPVQMCHFHQKQIITRHLTLNPKLEAGIELKKIAQTICKTNQKEFTAKLNHWHDKWASFLKEKTTDLETGKWFYTHRRIRSAYHSLRINLSFLFTYQKYPQLNIPNTTNPLEGCFSHLKELTKIHRGLKYTQKIKIINEILGK